MIVLDEHLQGRQLENDIRSWYQGDVVVISGLKPGVIKDDAIPAILRKTRRQPSFVTNNVRHFWKKILLDKRYCAVCFNIPDRDRASIPGLLKRLCRDQRFNSKRKRAGHVFRINSDGKGRYYNCDDLQDRPLAI